MPPPTPSRPEASSTPEIIKIARPTKRIHIPRLIEWFVAGFVGLVFVGVLLPTGPSVVVKSPQAKALAQAKQIGLALKLFAIDHDGNYPRQGIPEEMTTAPKDSNTAFACLFPTYLANELIFANKISAYQTAQPDNVIDQPYTGIPKETLQPGENVYGYVVGLSEGDPGNTPSSPMVQMDTAIIAAIPANLAAYGKVRAR